MALPIFEGLGF